MRVRLLYTDARRGELGLWDGMRAVPLLDGLRWPACPFWASGGSAVIERHPGRLHLLDHRGRPLRKRAVPDGVADACRARDGTYYLLSEEDDALGRYSATGDMLYSVRVGLCPKSVALSDMGLVAVAGGQDGSVTVFDASLRLMTRVTLGEYCACVAFIGGSLYALWQRYAGMGRCALCGVTPSLRVAPVAEFPGEPCLLRAHSGGALFIGTGDGVTLFCPRTGTRLWSSIAPTLPTAAAFSGGEVAVSDAQGGLFIGSRRYGELRGVHGGEELSGLCLSQRENDTGALSSC